jgi:hypothetical protein
MSLGDQYCCFDYPAEKAYNYDVKLILFVYILSLSTAFGSQWEDEVWTAKNKKISFKFNNKLSLRINEICFVKYNSCEALRATRYAKIKEYSSENGISPYSKICSDSTKGKVIFLTNSKGHSNSFCLFKDKSIIDTASLYKKVTK